MKNLVIILVFLIGLTGCNASPQISIASENDHIEIQRIENLEEQDFLDQFNLEVQDKEDSLDQIEIAATDYDANAFDEVSKYNTQEIIATDTEGKTDSIKVHYDVVKSEEDINAEEKETAKEEEAKLIEKYGFETNLNLKGEDFKRLHSLSINDTITSLNVAEQCELNEDVNNQYLEDIENGLDPSEPADLYTNKCYDVATVKINSTLNKSSSTKGSEANDAQMIKPLVKLVTDEALKDINGFHVIIWDMNDEKFLEYEINQEDSNKVRDDENSDNYTSTDDIVTSKKIY